jgi:hypothetical protein
LKEYLYFRENNTCTSKAHPEPFKRSCVKANHHRKFDFTLGLGYRCVFYEYATKTEVFNAVVSKEHCAPISYDYSSAHIL